MHIHRCRNWVHGCPSLIECDVPSERDHHGDSDEPYFGYCPMQDAECLDCEESRCADCGSVVRVETHAAGCRNHA